MLRLLIATAGLCSLGPRGALSSAAAGLGSLPLEQLLARLAELGHEAAARQQTLAALEQLRAGLLTGDRVDMASGQRQYLETASPLVAEVSFDARHRPSSTDTSRHFQLLRTVAEDVDVKFYGFMPLKRVASGSHLAAGPAALLVMVDSTWGFSAYDPESGGPPLLGPMDLGHGQGRPIVHMVTSSTQESHLVLTADDRGVLRAHSLRIVARRENRTAATAELAAGEPPPKRLSVSANFSCSFSLPSVGAPGALEQPELVSVLPVERGDRMYFVTGDSLGGISVFFNNGTLKGRVRVTEDPGGVRGLLKGQSQTVVFFSSHSFGSFSVSQVDVLSAPCTGWNSPVHDVVLDPSYQSSRVILSLVDGDVLVFTTMRGKNKACDLTNKFPHVSTLPFKLQNFRGHIMALTAPTADDPRAADALREVFFFNIAAMEDGYGASASKTITLQASFKPRQPDEIALAGLMGFAGQLDRTKAMAAIRFVGSKGLQLHSLSLKPPAALQASAVGDMLEDEWEEPGWYDFFTSGWIPKACVFGIALVGVVIWNLRKGSEGFFGGGDDEFDEAFFKEQVRKAQAASRAQGGED